MGKGEREREEEDEKRMVGGGGGGRERERERSAELWVACVRHLGVVVTRGRHGHLAGRGDDDDDGLKMVTWQRVCVVGGQPSRGHWGSVATGEWWGGGVAME